MTWPDTRDAALGEAGAPADGAAVNGVEPRREPAIPERTRRPQRRLPSHGHSWQRVFQTGMWLWVSSVIVTAWTGAVTMIPTVVLVGSFLVPVTAVVWYMDHYRSPACSVRRVLEALLVGGMVGVLMAAALEAWLPRGGIPFYVGVGLLEEGAKLAALMFVVRGLTRHTTRDGVVLGAAVGFGFAALESSGYAFTSLLVRDGHHMVGLSLSNLVFTELVRGVLAPVGHGLWTAILGGVLFSANRFRSPRITGRVVIALVAVAMLHASWDSMRVFALALTALFTATPAQRVAAAMGERVAATTGQLWAFVAFEIAGLALISALGFLWLWIIWRRSAPARARPSRPVDRSGAAAPRSWSTP